MSFRRLSVTQRLFILTAIALFPAIAILVSNVIDLRRSREAEIHDLAFRIGELSQLEMERIVSGAEGLLVALALSPIVRRFEEDACGPYLRSVDRELPFLDVLGVIAANGVVRCPRDLSSGSDTRSDRPYFTEAVRTRHFVVGTYTVSRTTGKPTLPLAAPLVDEGGAVTGVLVAGLDLQWLGERVRERSFANGSALTIADRNGVIIAREPFPERFVGTSIPDRFLPLVSAASPGTMDVVSQDGTDRIIGYFPASLTSARLYVSAGLSSENAFSSIDSATYRGLGLAGAACLLAFLATFATGRSLIRGPVQRMLATVGAWRQGEESARTGMTKEEGELGALGAAMDRFLDDLVEERASRRHAEEQRSLLVGELHHRVKNLLATVQAVASQTFKGAALDSASVDTFARRLAAMAKAHDLLMTENWASTDIHRTIGTGLELFRATDDERFDIDGPQLTLRAEAALALSMALHELSTNSVKYGALGAPAGRVHIRWAIEETPEGQRFFFSWAERGGPPVSPPTRKGFGSKMIERVLAAELSAKVDLAFPATGIVCIVRAPAQSVEAAA